ncbi:hypothetical protein DPMN_074645 [Dreissena polymorpha]|uniref:Uncharacterized protein n=1 Tax=Dreissena polymorpha TaxID=45954 RepID=A0A9D3YI38_DREPO|nr:hypothetical protein DPMN_074645 [Dreissena polymorpha]
MMMPHTTSVILTKIHKDWMKTVTSTVYTNKLLTDARTHNGRRTSHGHISSSCHFVTSELKNEYKSGVSVQKYIKSAMMALYGSTVFMRKKTCNTHGLKCTQACDFLFLSLVPLGA